MIDNEIAAGQQSAWKLLKKLGEGDAGEVYLVQSASAGQQQSWAILKRPRPSAFTGEMFRQSTQIRGEAKILKALSGAPPFNASLRVRTPALLDESKAGAEYNGRNFIVIERARGLDLAFLARVAQVGLEDYAESVAALDLEDRLLVDAISRSGKIPARLLLAVLYRLARFIEFIHSVHSAERGSQACGILWNDVKPDHLFWDAQRGVLTVIDWGNARFLESDLTTHDRQFSWMDDYRQLFEEMGRYLSLTAPELVTRLEWPGRFSTQNSTPEAIQALHGRLETALQEEDQNMAEARRGEETLLRADADLEISLTDIQAIQSQVLEFGEAPDFERSLRYTAGFAARLAQADRLEDLRTLASWAANLAGADPQQWKLVDLLSRLPGRTEGEQRRLFIDAIQSAISRQWDNALWDIATATVAATEAPDWWPDLTTALRGLALGPDHQFPIEGNLRPLVAVRRINLAVQAAARRLEEQVEAEGGGSEDADANPSGSAAALAQACQLIHCLKDEVIANWTQLDPSPPDCCLEYEAVEPVLAEAIGLLPEQHRSTLQSSVAALTQPKAQVALVLSAWSARNFLAARDSLRRLLLIDPDRKRVLRADQAILAAPDFLAKVQAGPQADDNFPEWITSVELRGRELCNQVGGAAWLDDILEGCKQMRKGAWPSDLALSRPEILRLMPWLARFERHERLAALLEEDAGSGAQAEQESTALALHGVEQARLGEGEALALIEPLDAWMAEARGSSARVVSGLLQLPGRPPQEAAVKLMRMDQIHYAQPLFLEEVKILAQLGDVAGVAHLYECGFILLDEGAAFPLVSATAAPPAAGQVLRIGPDAAPEFAARMDAMLEAGWTPYLAVEKQPQEDSLVLLCDAGLTRGQYQSMLTLLQMAVQICDILQVAHERSIVYRDHKLLHYYWRAASRGIYMIDWNVARYHPEGLTRTDLEMDIVQFGARGLHHILTGRAAPGALPLGPTRPEEIEQAARSYQTQWTYDDRRLSAGLRTILERVLAGEYTSIAGLRDDLKQSMMHLPDTHL
jgi:serine/threonine protein kinase